MTALAAQRTYRLTARFSATAAKTWGLWTVVCFVLAAIASAVYRAASGAYEEFAVFVLLCIPLLAAGLGWSHTQQAYPRTLAVGVTRKEFLAASALFGLGTVLATAAFTQLGTAYIDATSTSGAHLDFYGRTLAESLARPALYVACGAAAGAVMTRMRNRTAGAVAAAFVFAAVVYREVGVWGALQMTDRLPQEDGVMLELPVPGLSLAPVDAVGAVLFALLTWAVLARAPMHPKNG